MVTQVSLIDQKFKSKSRAIIFIALLDSLSAVATVMAQAFIFRPQSCNDFHRFNLPLVNSGFSESIAWIQAKFCCGILATYPPYLQIIFSFFFFFFH